MQHTSSLFPPASRRQRRRVGGGGKQPAQPGGEFEEIHRRSNECARIVAVLPSVRMPGSSAPSFTRYHQQRRLLNHKNRSCLNASSCCCPPVLPPPPFQRAHLPPSLACFFVVAPRCDDARRRARATTLESAGEQACCGRLTPPLRGPAAPAGTGCRRGSLSGGSGRRQPSGSLRTEGWWGE